MRLKVVKIVLLALVAMMALGTQTYAVSGTAKAKLLKCKRAADPADRYLTVFARMTTTTSDKMSIKLELLKKDQGSSAYSVIQTPLIGSWEDAQAGISNYTVRKKIANLSGPARYRAQVTFKWTDATGQETTVVKKTKICRIRDARPDLVIKSADDPLQFPSISKSRYPVVLQNAGGAIARNFKVSLSLDGVAQPTETVPQLLPNTLRAVTIEGATCTQGSQLIFTADPENSVSETDETNNTLTVTCPTSSTSSSVS